MATLRRRTLTGIIAASGFGGPVVLPPAPTLSANIPANAIGVLATIAAPEGYSWPSFQETLITSLGRDNVRATVDSFGNLEEIEAQTGGSGPGVAVNLGTILDNGPEFPFLDIIKSSEYLKVRRSSGGDLGERTSWIQAKAQGYLDANGWPTGTGENLIGYDVTFGTPYFAAKAQRIAQYEMRYNGATRPLVSGDMVDVGPGSVTNSRIIQWQTGGAWTLTLAPEELTELSIVRTGDHLTRWLAGEIWSPAFLNMLSGIKRMRFSGWQGTNNNPVEEWSERRPPEEFTQSAVGHKGGVSLEYCIDLANRTAIQPWFSIPIMASDDYIDTFATMVKDDLHPSLRAIIELSNETWNASFDQFAQIRDNYVRVFWNNGAVYNETQRIHSYHTKLATNVARRFNTVFTGSPTVKSNRLYHTLGTSSVGTTTHRVNIPAWKLFEPTEWIDPKVTFDSVAVTSYFGNEQNLLQGIRDRLTSGQTYTQITDYIETFLLNPANGQHTIPEKIEDLQASKSVSAPLPLIIYEGGQHIHSNKGDFTAVADFEAFMETYTQSAELVELYDIMYDGLMDAGVVQGPWMHHTLSSIPGSGGSWGLYRSLDWQSPVTDWFEEKLSESVEASSTWADTYVDVSEPTDATADVILNADAGGIAATTIDITVTVPGSAFIAITNVKRTGETSADVTVNTDQAGTLYLARLGDAGPYTAEEISSGNYPDTGSPNPAADSYAISAGVSTVALSGWGANWLNYIFATLDVGGEFSNVAGPYPPFRGDYTVDTTLLVGSGSSASIDLNTIATETIEIVSLSSDLGSAATFSGSTITVNATALSPQESQILATVRIVGETEEATTTINVVVEELGTMEVETQGAFILVSQVPSGGNTYFDLDDDGVEDVQLNATEKTDLADGPIFDSAYPVGITEAGGLLTINPGYPIFAGTSPSFSWALTRPDGVVLASATNDIDEVIYEPVAADAGLTLTLTVTATDNLGATIVTDIYQVPGGTDFTVANGSGVVTVTSRGLIRQPPTAVANGSGVVYITTR